MSNQPNRHGVFARALGEDWERLHPKVRERYGLGAGEGRQAIGHGTMTQIDRALVAVPAFWLLGLDDILVRKQGQDIPFTITSTPFEDEHGVPALFLHREFGFDSPEYFVDTLRWNPHTDSIIDLLGWRGQLGVELSIAAVDGALELTLGRQWLRVRGRYIRIPRPLAVSGTLVDRYDENCEEYTVNASVRLPVLGTVFSYSGYFENSFRPRDDAAEETIFETHAQTPLPGATSTCG